MMTAMGFVSAQNNVCEKYTINMHTVFGIEFVELV